MICIRSKHPLQEKNRATMFKNADWSHYLIYAFLAAIIYCIPVFIFLNDTSYTRAWLLYTGNALFLFTMVTFLLSFNRKRNKNASSMSMLGAGLITTVAGIMISCLLCFLLLSIMVPGLFHAGTPEKVLTNAPANTVQDKAKGLLFMIFGSATIGNFAAGLFVCIIFPFAIKGDQTKEKVPSEQARL